MSKSQPSDEDFTTPAGEREHEASTYMQLQDDLEGAGKTHAHLSTLLHLLGRHRAADQEASTAHRDMQEGAAAGEHAERLLLEEQIERDKHLTPAAVISKVRTAQPHLQATVSVLHQAVLGSVHRDDPDRLELEQMYPQLHEQLARSVENHQQAIVVLNLVEQYLRRVQQLAGSHSVVHEAWQGQIERLAAHL